MGALGTRLSLRPLFSEARTVFAKPRAARAARSWSRILKLEPRHCEERLVRRSSTSEGGSDEAIHSSFARRDGLLRCARNDGLRIGWLKIESISVVPDKRANGSRERAPDDRLRERDPGPITTNVHC